ncbi:hypothetical protein ACN47E_005538 [Coniothyrium glycines]
MLRKQTLSHYRLSIIYLLDIFGLTSHMVVCLLRLYGVQYYADVTSFALRQTDIDYRAQSSGYQNTLSGPSYVRSHTNMTPTKDIEASKRFQPPAWMLLEATKNIENAKFSQDQLIEDIRKAALRAQTPAAREAWASDFERLRGLEKQRSLQENIGGGRNNKGMDISTQPPAVLSLASTASPNTFEDAEEQRKDRSKAKQTNSATGKIPVVFKDHVVSPLIAESSRCGAQREAAARTQTSVSAVLPRSSLFISETIKYPVASKLPGWLLAISPSSIEMKQLERKRPPSYTALEALKDCIRRCEAEQKPVRLNLLFEELRNHIHKAEIKLEVTAHIIKKAKILTPENGLPKIFAEEADFPPDLKADTYQLYTRWSAGIFSVNLLRGLILGKAKDRNADRLDPDYRSAHYTDPRVHGANNLVLGQWWPTQLCAVRDGAHGAPQAGIYGARDQGAFSIVLSGGGGYHDQDNGEEIWYSGTEGKDFSPTENTSHLLQSIELRYPVRVLRSHQLNKKNRYRPEVGLRYDGLYTVMMAQNVDEEKAMYRFRLVRCEGQEAIRCEDNAARRPTIFEVEEWERLRAEKKWQ